jgi:hypothetical protein
MMKVGSLNFPQFGKEASNQDQALARHNETQNHLVLERHDHKDDHVPIMAQLTDWMY